MNNNKLIIAAAGSGKTTLLIDEAMKIKNGKVLFTTYTDNNAGEIKQKFISEYKYIPKFITIQTWFSFLIKHGAKPYQGSYNEQMFGYDIKGLKLVNEKSGYKIDKNGKPIIVNKHRSYWPEQDIKKHFFDIRNRIFSDKLSKFVFKANKSSDNKVINRIARIYTHIFIDEAQDLAGYDLEIVKLLLNTNSNIMLVADPRQTTYSTHQESKHKKYADGKIKDFFLKKCKKLIDIDEDSLEVSHRNNQEICNFSSALYPEFPKSKPCACCRDNTGTYNGVWLVQKKDVKLYSSQDKYNIVILRLNKKQKSSNTLCPAFNFGASKGKTFERVLIYPTKEMEKWIFDHGTELKNKTRAKFYVAITRAKYSAAIVVNDGVQINGSSDLKIWTPRE